MSLLLGLYSTFISTVVPFVLLLGILVFVHELGHFLVARACGVRVEVFSLGFGKKLLQFKKGDTNYCISMIPLGGYVKMFGEQSVDAATIAVEDRAVSFTHKKVWQRISIVLAGPLMNFFFAILVFGFISYRGEETRAARFSEVIADSLAAKSGLQSQDLITAVNGKKVRSFEEYQNEINQFINQTTELTVQQNEAPERVVKISVQSTDNPNIFSLTKRIGTIEGVQPYTKGSVVAIKPGSLASQLGLKTGDEITQIADKKVTSWNQLSSLINLKNTSVTIERPLLEKKETLTLQVNLNETTKIKSIEDLGFDNSDLYLEQIVPGSPAELAGLQKYDKLISINSKPIQTWEDVLNTVKNFDGKDSLEFKIEREGTEVIKKITPQVTSQMTFQGKEEKRYTIGILPMANISQPEVIVVKDGLIDSIAKGYSRAVDISVMTVLSFVRLFQGEVSHKNVGGLISIGKAAKDSYALGLQTFLSTMGILSISLFILNLLPVPVLDGGHLVFYFIEIIKGSPLSGKKLEVAHQIGFALLMGLMVLALFNDFTKFIFKT